MKILFALLAFNLLLINQAFGKQLYGFSNLSINYLDWSKRTEEVSKTGVGRKFDFIYIEVEAGAGFDWGDIYGFVDMENPGKPVTSTPSNNRVAIKGSVAYNLGESNFNLYSHIFTLNEKGFSDQNRVLGFSYDYNTGFGLWIKPFLGFHNQTDVGSNGYMAGWVFGHDFQIGSHRFSIANWHEFEFERDKDYQGFYGVTNDYVPTNGRSYGHNGAASIWYHPTKQFTVGLQYRYADRKLGTPHYQDAMISSVKFNF